jgi:hypothetical protein
MKNKTLKIGLSSYMLLEELRLYMMKNKKITISKKGLLEWLIRIAHEENFKE